MAEPGVLRRRGFGETSRRDRWWASPLAVFLGLSAFIVYATVAGTVGEHYFYHEGGAHYLSPMYSPLLYGQSHEPRVFDAERPPFWPNWLIFSPAMLILVGPAGMRVTCYYYRGAYYKSFWADPPACAVGEPRKSYRGEHKLPLILQNLHRYFFYIAVVYVVILTWDGLRAFFFTTPEGGTEFGIGIGSIVLLTNAVLLGGYTFGCHCARHLFGGRHDCISKIPVRQGCYNCATALNKKHMNWAWFSLVWVGFTDLYVRLCSMGIWSDWRIL